MKTLLLAAVTALALTTPAQAVGWVCKVTDPTGTPLNVRSEPNSNAKVLRTVKNGREAIIEDVTKDDCWALVIIVEPKFDKDGLPIPDGWVFMTWTTASASPPIPQGDRRLQ
jgi:hypothetical protein